MGETFLLVKPSLGEVALDDVFFTRKTKITSKRTKEHDGERSSRELDGLIETPFFLLWELLKTAGSPAFLDSRWLQRLFFCFYPQCLGKWSNLEEYVGKSPLKPPTRHSASTASEEFMVNKTSLKIYHHSAMSLRLKKWWPERGNFSCSTNASWRPAQLGELLGGLAPS